MNGNGFEIICENIRTQNRAINVIFLEIHKTNNKLNGYYLSKFVRT